MAFERVSDNLHRLNENIREFAKSSAEYYKLDLFNKTMKGATAAVKGVVVAFFILFAILFLSIAISVALSDWLDAPSSGFFIVGGIYLLTGLFIVFFGSSFINRMMLSKASKQFFKEPEEGPKTAHPEFTSPNNLQPEEKPVEDNERV
ncbi:Putative Holin-X, holin superfamily III [Salinimicrobium catena]|uniref:Putative Holin-X, holin superfamily III n=1 Tax=Salinimicrobium catena TaxID=390640 RepID=A0A1H5IJE4_9FLAO|nr:phage holin family protein [Salinimicrobium catena]SDK78222.1 Putative Holin-X, holin superfamily III [Salinimicrobium catena]SEE40300.1 Putative Holin-X, holin superfamily III [Salinimicrobium catena]